MTISSKESKAIDTFVKVFKGSHARVNQSSLQYKILDSDKTPIAYAHVAVCNKVISNAYPLMITANDISSVVSKRLNPIIIWACDDGIIYGKIKEIYGEIKWGRVLPHLLHSELICFYEKQKYFKYIKYS